MKETEPLGFGDADTDSDTDSDTDADSDADTDVDPQEEIYDDCANECVEETAFHAFTGNTLSAGVDIGFTGWSFFCVAYDDTPTDSVELFTYDDVALAGGIPGLGNAADVGVAVENAIGLWNGISDARLTLSAVSGPASSAGYSQIMYQSGHHPETNVLGAVIEMGSQGSPDVLYSYILIYEEYLPEPASAGGAPLPPSPSPLTINGSYSSVSLTSVLAHEIGHALGIDHLLDPSTGYLMSEELRYNFNPPLSPTGEWAAKFLYPDWLQSPIPQGGSITGSCNPPA